MAALFPQRTAQDERTEPQPPDDLLERARQQAQQELASMQKPPKQASKGTLLTGQRRFQ